MCGIMTSWGLEGKKPYGQLYTDVNVFSVLKCILKKKKNTKWKKNHSTYESPLVAKVIGETRRRRSRIR